MNEAGGAVLPKAEPVPAASALVRVIDLGGAAQACIPGLYAWVVTVAPVAWGRGASFLSKGTAIAGLVSLAAALVLEHRRRQDAARARTVAVWGLALSSAFTWLLEPAALSLLKVDAATGFAGMLGWGLFAFACAAPPVRRDEANEARVVEGPPLRPRTRVARGDAAIIAGGAVVACALQVVGWRSGPAERAILVRLVALAAGLAVLGAGTTIALARHVRRPQASRRERLRRLLPWLSLLSVLALTRIAFLVFTGR